MNTKPFKCKEIIANSDKLLEVLIHMHIQFMRCHESQCFGIQASPSLSCLKIALNYFSAQKHFYQSRPRKLKLLLNTLLVLDQPFELSSY